MHIAALLPHLTALTCLTTPPDGVWERFQATANDYQAELRDKVERELTARRQIIAGAFQHRLTRHQTASKERRQEARAALERFLSAYPDHPQHTAPAMLKLAVLLLEDDDSRAVPRARTLAATAQKRFPAHKDADQAHYLVAWCADHQDDFAAARQAWARLVEAHPTSRYAAEAWLRIGEGHFDDARWTAAAAAYEHVVRRTDSRFFEMGLYKLAWTRFMQGRPAVAVAGFNRLLALPRTGPLRAALRDEAVAFLGRTLAEGDWDGDGTLDPEAGAHRVFRYAPAAGPQSRAVRLEAAQALFELHEPAHYRASAQVLAAVIGAAPTHADNPALHQRVIEALTLAGDRAAAQHARATLVANLDSGSAWARANPTQARRARRMVDETLMDSARADHAQAQTLRLRAVVSGGSRAAASRLYARAATAYATYAARPVGAALAREARFLRAEALFWGEQPLAAATQYARVRDGRPHDKRTEESAYSAVQAVLAHIDTEVAAGRLRPAVLGLERKDTAEAVPAIGVVWAEHVDAYTSMRLENKKRGAWLPTQHVRVATMLLSHGRLDDARRRLELAARYTPGSPVATLATEHLLASYGSDLTTARATLAALAGDDIITREVAARLGARLAQAALVADFDGATQHFAKRDYARAATGFEAVAKKATGPMRIRARFNAAMAQLQLGRHALARPHLKAVRAATGHALQRPATEHLAGSFERTLELAEAAQTYRELLRRFPAAGTAARLDRVAQVENALGRPTDAARLFEGARRPLAAARAWQAAGRITDQRRVLLAGLKTESSPLRRVRLAAALGDALTDRRRAQRRYAQAVATFRTAGGRPGTPAAESAARAGFKQLEHRFSRFQSVELSGSPKRLMRTAAAQTRALVALEAAYAELIEYKSFGWTIAATYRMGRLHELFARMLLEAPVPPMSPEEYDIYVADIEERSVFSAMTESSSQLMFCPISRFRTLLVTMTFLNSSRHSTSVPRSSLTSTV